MYTYLELRRQIVHLLLGLVFLAGIAYGVFFWWSFLFLLFMGATTLFVAQKLPLKQVLRMLAFLDRKDAYFHGFGAFTFVTAFMLTTLFFRPEIALPALTIMVLGDSIATIIGHYAGRYFLPWNKKKTWEGFIVGFLVAVTGSGFFLSFPLAFIASLLAMILESIKWPHPLCDDNVLMPLVAALFLFFFL